MGFAINHNVPSVAALGALDRTTGSIAKSLSKLSTGLRIVKSGDDASGLVISERMRAQINGLNTAKLNAQEGINMLSTAEGVLNEIHSIMQRMNTLAVRADNDVTIAAGSSELQALQDESDALVSEIDRISGYATFNGVTLLDGSVSGNLQVGPGAGAANSIAVNIGTVDAAALSVDSLTLGDGGAAITAINAAIETLGSTRGDLGVAMNQLEHTVVNLDIMIENTVASESRIRDVDMAAEISNFTRLQILQQSGTSMLAQANAQPQAVLSLLQ
ncbi:flagellin FliC [bacterium]|nr:flagellin FliC [bacterium]